MIQINNELAIPAAELDFRFSRSSGPGGQHVQKSSTRVELLFDVARSPSLTDDQRSRISKRLERYLDTEGVLHLTSQSERSQRRNRQEVVDRLAELLRSALKRRKKRKPTHPTAASQERRIQRKKERGEKKKLRGSVERDEW
ncbi:MAG: aminoacyl-tRNA hydrolase [Anaerolineae bacterium]|nr:aminoacyl-tRNA hydrolase [Anaerolineae bacterium]